LTVQVAFTKKANLFKEELTEKYFLAKQNALDDYLIFMVIAEDIGYNATGRNNNNNELIEIGKELEKCIAYINKTENNNGRKKNYYIQ
jgi:type I restriction enzyme M protein